MKVSVHYTNLIYGVNGNMKANKESVRNKTKQVTIENILGDEHYEVDLDVNYRVLYVPANPQADNDIDYFGYTEVEIDSIEWEGTDINDCVEEIGIELLMSRATIIDRVTTIIGQEEGV